MAGEVSFDLRWFGAKTRGSFSDPSLPFRMDFVQTGAHLSWSGTTGSDTFHTTDGAQTVNFAQIANARNGVFFNDGGSDERRDFQGTGSKPTVAAISV